jgi:hypothetical protein
MFTEIMEELFGPEPAEDVGLRADTQRVGVIE